MQMQGHFRLGGVLVLAALLGAGAVPALEWTWGPVLPLPTSCRATTVVNGIVITVGGTQWEEHASGTKIKRWSKAVYSLDSESAQWRKLPDYPLACDSAAASSVGSMLFVVGGRDDKRAFGDVFRLDLSRTTPHWEQVPALPKPRWGAGAVSIRGILYVAGGLEGELATSGEDRPARDVLAFDPMRPIVGWRIVARIPGPALNWRSIAASDGQLYLFGGLTYKPASTDRGFLPHREAYALDIDKRAWRMLAPLPVAMGSGAATTLNSHAILIAGGYALALPNRETTDHKVRTHFTAQCFLYDTLQNRYFGLAPMKMGLVDFGFVQCFGKLLVIGGEDGPYRSRTDLTEVGSFR